MSAAPPPDHPAIAAPRIGILIVKPLAAELGQIDLYFLLAAVDLLAMDRSLFVQRPAAETLAEGGEGGIHGDSQGQVAWSFSKVSSLSCLSLVRMASFLT